MKRVRTPVSLVLSLVLTSVTFPALAQQQATSAPAWQQSLRNDPSRDYAYTRFTLPGRFVKPAADAATPAPTLTLDCVTARDSHPLTGRVLAANVSAGSALKVVYVEPLEIHGTSYFCLLYTSDAADE